MKALGVNVALNTEVDAEYVRSMAPDAVIVATGGVDVVPDIPGIDKRIVTSGEDLHKQLEAFNKIIPIEALETLTQGRRHLPRVNVSGKRLMVRILGSR